ncbi:MAG: hypothetical protein EWM50_02005 [Gottschalkiaceae bacterium]|nr:MAG: hypothetical protein EWM50_02005 [Gottschalkiaceae bacterium]
MTIKEIESFEKFLADAFSDGVVFRELRLSNEEIEYFKVTYPKVSLNKIQESSCADGKVWVEVRLHNFV